MDINFFTDDTQREVDVCLLSFLYLTTGPPPRGGRPPYDFRESAPGWDRGAGRGRRGNWGRGGPPDSK